MKSDLKDHGIHTDGEVSMDDINKYMLYKTFTKTLTKIFTRDMFLEENGDLVKD